MEMKEQSKVCALRTDLKKRLPSCICVLKLRRAGKRSTSCQYL